MQEIIDKLTELNNFLLDWDWEWDNYLWEIKLYKQLKEIEKLLKISFEKLTPLVIREVENNKWEYKEFSISQRKTLNYKENYLYLSKNNELKEIEKQIKIATEMHEKGSSYVDKDWVIIDPVSVSYSEVLTYRPIK